MNGKFILSIFVTGFGCGVIGVTTFAAFAEWWDSWRFRSKNPPQEILKKDET